MNESIKTTCYVGAALVLSAVGVFMLPHAEPQLPENDPALTTAIFGELKSGEDVRAIRLAAVNSETGKYETLTFGRREGRWLISSHDNYPADATDKIKELVTSLVGLKALRIQTELDKDHEEYGVIEPTADAASTANKKNVGVLVEFQGDGERKLAQLIIGKKAVGGESGESGGEGDGEQRFVRIPGTPRVYIAKVKPLLMAKQDKKRTALLFENWINKDLLRVKGADIARLTINDYGIFTSFDRERDAVTKVSERHSKSLLSFDEKEFKWKLDQLFVYNRESEPVAVALTDTEELNSTKLNDLKNALEHLEIVSAFARPEAAASNEGLETKAFQNAQAEESLFQHGFMQGRLKGEDSNIVCAAGEVVVGLKDGIDIRLRFGSPPKNDKAASSGKLNRTLLVSAKYNGARIPKPEMLPLRPLPAAGSEKKPEEKKADDKKPAEDKKTDDKKSDEKKSEEKKADEKKDDEKKGDENQPDVKQIEKDNDSITKRNEQALKKWEEETKKAQGRARDLNARFAAWYYVVSDEVYHKILPGRQDIVAEKKTGKDEGFGIDAFRKLEKEGLIKTPPAPPGGEGGVPPGFQFGPM